MLIVLQTLSGICCITTGFTLAAPKLHLLQRISAFVAKFAATTIFNSIYLSTAELYPTAARNSIIGSCSTIGRVGGVISLLMAGLSQIWVPIPMFIYGILALSAGFASIFLPETKGLPLPQTIEEAIQVGRKKLESK